MKKIFTFALATTMLISLVACGSNNKTTEKSTTQNPQFSMEDIVWSVDEGIVHGERYVLMSYTNNSPFVISGLEIFFTEKDSISIEEKEIYYSEVQKLFDFSDDDLADVKEREISMHTETDKIVAVGETASNINCYYYSGYYYLKNLAHYNLVEPDIATIRYIDDGKIYTVNYDFKSDKYTMDNKTVEAYQWSTTTLGDRIPKPDVQVVERGLDNETIFMFSAYGISLDQFNAYVEECKAIGYTIDSYSYEGSYDADNSEMYNIDLYYREDDNCMRGTVTAPEKIDTEDINLPVDDKSENDTSDALSNDMRPEFKEAMDSYEAFYDEYCEFMKKFANNPSDLGLLAEYGDMMSKMTDMSEKFDAWDEDEMNKAELEYYLEVNNRVAQKLLEFVQ